MEKTKEELVSYIIYYFVIFFVIPFIVLGTGLIIKDPAWFIQYMFFVYPITILLFLWNYKKSFKNKIEIYKKYLLIIWMFLLVIYGFSSIYIYIRIGFLIKSSSFF